MNQDLSHALFLTEGRALYDEAAKRLLSQKIVLAYILRECLPEYQDYTPEEIAEQFIEGDPQVGETAVHADEEISECEKPERILGLNTEDITVTEGLVRYDIRFKVLLPKDPERLYLILNIEAQNEQQTWYPLLKRAVYYGSRLISSQYGTVFSGMDYGAVKKVYSIWICTKSAKKYRNSMNRYEMVEECLVGESKSDPENYRLMNLILLHVGEYDEGTHEGVLGFLEVLLSGKLQAEEKRQILQEQYHITMTKKMSEEVTQMCNLSWGIYQDGVEQGIEQKGKEVAFALYQDGMPLEKIARIVSESMTKIQEWLAELTEESASDPV